jgi:hypothetical protein
MAADSTLWTSLAKKQEKIFNNLRNSGNLVRNSGNLVRNSSNLVRNSGNLVRAANSNDLCVLFLHGSFALSFRTSSRKLQLTKS